MTDKNDTNVSVSIKQKNQSQSQKINITSTSNNVNIKVNSSTSNNTKNKVNSTDNYIDKLINIFKIFEMQYIVAIVILISFNNLYLNIFALVLSLIYVYKAITASPYNKNITEADKKENDINILKEKYANNEISDEEFESQMKELIE